MPAPFPRSSVVALWSWLAAGQVDSSASEGSCFRLQTAVTPGLVDRTNCTMVHRWSLR